MKRTLIPILLLLSLTLSAQNTPSDSLRDVSWRVKERIDTLDEARITALRDRKVARTQTGLMKLDSRKFSRGYAFMGRPDLIKTLQMLPGVGAGSELMSGLYVHGGTGTDNLFLLDGVPLYQVSHLAGLFSSFNTEIIDNLDFYKSGFPARYGGRLSSVVDITTRTGDMHEYHGMFSIGLIDGNIQLEGPILKGRTSFSLALRRSWLDIVTTPVLWYLNRTEGTGEDVDMSYALWDGNAGITHKLDDRNTLALNFYMGRDDLGIGVDDMEEYDMDVVTEWGNILTSLNWKSILSDSIESYVILYHSNSMSRMGMVMDETIENEYISMDAANITRINDFGLKADFDWIPDAVHHMRFGGSYQFHTYDPERYDRMTGFVEDTGFSYDMSEGSRYTGHEPSVYCEDEMSLAEGFRLNAGLRYSIFAVPGKAYHGLEPRVAMSLDITDRISFKASYTEMNQYNHQVASNYMDLPTNTWMPVTESVRPMHSRQAAGGFYFDFPNGMVFNVEGYWKTMDHLLEYTGTNSMFPPLDEWEHAFSEGKGRAYGMEVELAWRTEKTDLSAYYTLSWSERFFEDIHPQWYPDRNDNRHKLTLMASHSLGKGFDVYAAWNWHTGNRFTAYSHVSGDPYYGEQYHYSAPNNARLPAYHRLDIGMNFRRRTPKGNEKVWNLSIYNVYCRMNPFMATIVQEEDGTFKGVGVGIVPIIPTISYSYSF